VARLVEHLAGRCHLRGRILEAEREVGADRPRGKLAPQEHRGDATHRLLLLRREVDPAVARDQVGQHGAPVPRLLVRDVVEAGELACARLGARDHVA
jgi:hypothetical protein